MTVSIFQIIICANMSDQLPDTIKPQSLFDTGESVSGWTPLANLDRLAALLVNNIGDVETQLDFAKDAQGLRTIRGSIKAELPLQCQRCLQAVLYPVNIKLSLAMVINAEQSERLPQAYDPLLFVTSMLSLSALIEDELILALPLVAKHVDEACHMTNGASNSQVTVVEVAEKAHPFAALAQIKGKLGST